MGCILTVFVGKGVTAGVVGANAEMILDVVIVVVVFAMRMLSVACNLTLPGAVERRAVDAGGDAAGVSGTGADDGRKAA